MDILKCSCSPGFSVLCLCLSLPSVSWQGFAEHPVLSILCSTVWAAEMNRLHREPPFRGLNVGSAPWLTLCPLTAVCAPQVAEPVGDFQPNYYPPLGQPPLGQPPQPQFLPPGLLSALHFLLPPLPPPPPATFSLTVLSDTDKENTGE